MVTPIPQNRIFTGTITLHLTPHPAPWTRKTASSPDDFFNNIFFVYL